MAYIGSFPADKTSGAKPRNEFTGDGSTVNFTLSQEVPGGFESNVLVIVDNVIQQPVESYTIGGDNLTLQFSEAPAASAVVYVLHQGNATYQMVPVVGSVTPDKLSENLRNFTVDTFTGNGSTVDYTLTDTPASANSILVIVDGIVQTKTTNYTLSGTTLTFTGAPDNGAAITVIHLGFSTVSRTAVPDGSITTAKIADNAITSAKLGFDVIVAEDIAANAITVAEIANGAVTPAKLSTGGLYWDTSSNVGIGTTSPSTQLQVNSGATTYSDQLRIRNTNYGNADIGVGNGIMALATDMSNIAFYTSSSLGTTGSSAPSNERMRIDPNGNLFLGATSSASNSTKLLSYATADQSGITINATNASQTNDVVLIRNTRNTSNGSYNALAVYNDGAGAYRFQLTDGGNIGLFGGQIKFPASQNASSDANTLDDYEEGTFTPTFASSSGSITAYNSNGFYIKVGRLVFVQLFCNVTNVGTATGTLNFAGLPFGVNGAFGSNQGQIAAVVRESNMTGTTYYAYMPGGNSSSGYITSLSSGGITWSSNGIWPLTFTYYTSS